MAPAYPEQDMDAFEEPMKTACTEKGIEYRGCFDCQGFLAETMHEPVQKNWALMMKSGQGWSNR